MLTGPSPESYQQFLLVVVRSQSEELIHVVRKANKKIRFDRSIDEARQQERELCLVTGKESF